MMIWLEALASQPAHFALMFCRPLHHSPLRTLRWTSWLRRPRASLPRPTRSWEPWASARSRRSRPALWCHPLLCPTTYAALAAAGSLLPLPSGPRTVTRWPALPVPARRSPTALSGLSAASPSPLTGLRSRCLLTTATPLTSPRWLTSSLTCWRTRRRVCLLSTHRPLGFVSRRVCTR